MLLTFTLIFAICVQGNEEDFQCPTPEDRKHAWYSGRVCKHPNNYQCCFNELINNHTMSCCYAYGTDGPIKCCGRDPPSNDDFDMLTMVIVACVVAMAFLLVVEIIKRLAQRKPD